MFTELTRHRRFVFVNAWTEMRFRYTGTAMGVLWHIIQPLSMIVLFSFVFSGLMPMRHGTGAIAFLVYFSAGMLPWLAFTDCIVRCTTSLVDNAHYLRKIALPEFLFVARTAVTSGLMMLVTLLLVVGTALLSGLQPSWAWLTVPFAGVLMIVFGFGCGLILSPLHVFARDTGQAVGMVMQFWMWLTPVILVESVMPAPLRAAQAVNPGAWYISAIREPLLTGAPAPLSTWALMFLASTISVLVGHRLLWRVRSDVRDTL